MRWRSRWAMYYVYCVLCETTKTTVSLSLYNMFVDDYPCLILLYVFLLSSSIKKTLGVYILSLVRSDTPFVLDKLGYIVSWKSLKHLYSIGNGGKRQGTLQWKLYTCVMPRNLIHVLRRIMITRFVNYITYQKI